MTRAEIMDNLDEDHPINAAAQLEDSGESDQVIEASPLAHSHRLSFSDTSTSSGSPIQHDAFAYRTIGAAIVLRSYQPKNSFLEDTTSAGGTAPEPSPEDFEKPVLSPFLYCSDSLYPELSLAGPTILDMPQNNKTISLLNIEQELPDCPTEPPSMPAVPPPGTTLLDSGEIVESHICHAADGLPQTSSFGITDSHQHSSPPPAYRPRSIEIYQVGPDASIETPTALSDRPATPPQADEALAADQGSELAAPDNTTESLGYSQLDLTSEARANYSTSDDDVSLTLPTLPLTLQKVDVAGRSLMENQGGDLISVADGDVSKEKRMSKDSPKFAVECDEPPPSEFSLSDTLNVPTSSHADESEPPSTPSANPTESNLVESAEIDLVESAETNLVESAQINPIKLAEINPVESAEITVVESTELKLVESAEENQVESADSCAIDSPEDAGPRVNEEVAQKSHVASATLRESMSEPCVVELSPEAETDQSSSVMPSKPVESANDISPPPATADNQEDLSIVTGLNPDPSPAIPTQPDNTPIADGDESTKPLETSQTDKDPVEHGPVDSLQTGRNSATFPSSGPAEADGVNSRSLNPTNRLSSSSEIVDPLLRSNNVNESLQDTTHRVTVDESQGLATEILKTPESVLTRGRTRRVRSISVFFRSTNSKKDPAHGSSTAGVPLADEENRPFGMKTLSTRKSFSMLKRKSALFSGNRTPHNQPVPPIPGALGAHVSKDLQVQHTSHSDDKVKIFESVQSKISTPPVEKSDTHTPSSPQDHEVRSEQSCPAAATVPSTADSKDEKSGRKFTISLAKRYFKGDGGRGGASTGGGQPAETLEGPFASVIGGIGYSPSAHRPNTLKKGRTLSSYAPSPVLKDLRLTGLFSKILGRKNHAGEIFQDV